MPSELQLQTLFLPASSLPPLPLFVAITLCSELFSVEPMCVTVASNSEEDPPSSLPLPLPSPVPSELSETESTTSSDDSNGPTLASIYNPSTCRFEPVAPGTSEFQSPSRRRAKDLHKHTASTLTSPCALTSPSTLTSLDTGARPEGTQPATNVASSGGVGAMQSMASTLPNSPTNQPQAPPIASATAPADIPQAPSAAQLPTPGAAQAAALILPPPHLLICLKKAAVYYSIIRGSQCGVFTDWLTVEVAAKSRNGSWKKHFSWVEAVAYYTEAWDAGIIAVV